LAVIPEVEKESIPLISLAGAVEIIEPARKWVFKVAHTDRMAAAKIFEDLRKRHLTQVALITGDGGFDKSGRAQILKLAPEYGITLAPEYGITLVADESYGNKDTDMTTPLTKIRATSAQAIINFGFGQAPQLSPRTSNNWVSACRSTSLMGLPPKLSSTWQVTQQKGCACRQRLWWLPGN